MNLYKSTFQFNQAWQAGVINLRENAYLLANGTKFDMNQAYLSAGAIYATTSSFMDLNDCRFTSNKAPESSAI